MVRSRIGGPLARTELPDRQPGPANLMRRPPPARHERSLKEFTVEQSNITATFGAAAQDFATLSKASRMTIAALYQHPLSHNLEWSRVVALFEKLGTVDQRSHDKVSFSIGSEHHELLKRHGKDLAAPDVMTLRHMLSRAGWSPPASSHQASSHQASAHQASSGRDAADPAATTSAASPDLLVVVEHHEARLFHLDIRSADLIDHVIKPYDPHHILHHLAHKDQSREPGQRAPEDHTFYERIAQAAVLAGRVVVIGHGEGHSNAADHLMEYVRQHHPAIFQKMVCELSADLSALTAPQLLALGRRALRA